MDQHDTTRSLFDNATKDDNININSNTSNIAGDGRRFNNKKRVSFGRRISVTTFANYSYGPAPSPSMSQSQLPSGFLDDTYTLFEQNHQNTEQQNEIKDDKNENLHCDDDDMHEFYDEENAEQRMCGSPTFCIGDVSNRSKLLDVTSPALGIGIELQPELQQPELEVDSIPKQDVDFANNLCDVISPGPNNLIQSTSTPNQDALNSDSSSIGNLSLALNSTTLKSVTTNEDIDEELELHEKNFAAAIDNYMTKKKRFYELENAKLDIIEQFVKRRLIFRQQRDQTETDFKSDIAQTLAEINKNIS